jgi:hypothetical protein
MEKLFGMRISIKKMIVKLMKMVMKMLKIAKED